MLSYSVGTPEVEVLYLVEFEVDGSSVCLEVSTSAVIRFVLNLTPMLRNNENPWGAGFF